MSRADPGQRYEGYIKEYSRDTARGIVTMGPFQAPFVGTCFYGERGQRHPYVGQKVTILTQGKDILAIMASTSSE